MYKCTWQVLQVSEAVWKPLTGIKNSLSKVFLPSACFSPEVTSSLRAFEGAAKHDMPKRAASLQHSVACRPCYRPLGGHDVPLLTRIRTSILRFPVITDGPSPECRSCSDSDSFLLFL